MGAKENTPDGFEEEIQPSEMETQVRKFAHTRNSEEGNISHISSESMALTTLSKDDKKDKKKKKEKKSKDKKKDKKLQEPFLGGASNKGDKPLRGRRQHSMENHVDDGYLRHHSDHRIRTRRQDADADVCFHCLRNALHCYNIVILIMGVGALAVGIWLLVTDFSAREVSVVIDSNLFEIGTYLILAGGGLIALLAFCGCCGTMREDRCILGFYGVVLVLVFMALIVGGVLAFMFRENMTSDFKEKLVVTIEKQYGYEIRTNTHNRLVTDAWDSIQRKLKCCGAYGNQSSDFSWAIYKGHSDWWAKRPSGDKYPMVPDSCCVPDMEKEKCQGRVYIEGPPNKGPPFKATHKENPHLYTTGCYDKVIDYMLQHSLILGAVAFAVPIFLIVGTIIAFCLCARVKKGDDDEEDI
ncbi:tetraspanin-18B-like isoform X1 [Argopecten irradians]|uniref:tetraspanin-18B-like isoform X1 n=2 Tax=Argopecten irradians TaxID=31199 RepID=UPI00371FA0E9